MRSLATELPKFYSQFLPELTLMEFPKEVFSTCDDCAMCKPNGYSVRKFSSDTKCCTYFPFLPNYLIGAILSSNEPTLEVGRARLRQRIAEKIGVCPTGISAPRRYQLLFQNTLAFGNSISLLCPYFERSSGRCTIWQFRDAVCSTFFCKTVAGKSGKQYWDNVKMYLLHIQRTLMQFAMQRMNLPAESILGMLKMESVMVSAKLTADDIDGKTPTTENYKSLWSGVNVSETDFYISCFNIVKDLSAHEIEQIAGIEKTIRFKAMLERINMIKVVPKFLVKNRRLSFTTDHNGNYIIHLNDTESTISLPVEVVDFFDGNLSTEQVLTRLSMAGIALDRDVIIPLIQNSILVPKVASRKAG